MCADESLRKSVFVVQVLKTGRKEKSLNEQQKDDWSSESYRTESSQK